MGKPIFENKLIPTTLHPNKYSIPSGSVTLGNSLFNRKTQEKLGKTKKTQETLRKAKKMQILKLTGQCSG